MPLLRADRVIVACAPNGARRGKADHPALPMTPDELTACARDIADAGASLLHLHVRDKHGGHSLDPGRYRDAIAAIRDSVGDEIVIQITTEAVGKYSPEQQMQTVRELRPEAASCALRELCPAESDERSFAKFLAECRETGVWVQHILYDDADAQRFIALRRSGVIAEPRAFILLVLGRYGGGESDPYTVASRAAPFVNDATVDWAVCAFGASEFDAALAAAKVGGHARLGFENNLMSPEGELAHSNAEQIRRFTAALPALGLIAATASEIRATLGVSGQRKPTSA